MLQIVLTSVAWYAIPKGIEYLTSRPSNLESRVDHIRARLFACKSTLQQRCANIAFLKDVGKITPIFCSYMWIATLLVPGLGEIFSPSIPGCRQIVLCCLIFSCKQNVLMPLFTKFLNSKHGLNFITSRLGFAFASTELGLALIENHLGKVIHGTNGIRMALRSSCEEELLSVLRRKLEYAVALDLLTAPNTNGTSLINRMYIYRDMLTVLNNRDFQRGYQLFSLRQLHQFDPPFIEAGGIDHTPSLPDYPEDIHDTDLILCAVKCPILGSSPKKTITDPTNRKTVYDYETFKAYLQHRRTSPVTRQPISEEFDIRYEAGSRYDSILNYRKVCLQSEILQDPGEFISHLRQVFTEISQLSDTNGIKEASESVQEFFQKGFLNAYNISHLNSVDSYETWKRNHNKDLNERSNEDVFTSVLIAEIDQFPFIMQDLSLEIQTIKEKGEELIQDFL